MGILKTLASLFVRSVLVVLVVIMDWPHSAMADTDAAWAENERVVIEDVQESLYILGYLSVNDVDAVVGRKTALAIRRFENDYNMPMRGRITDDLHQLLLDLAFPNREGVELIGAVAVAEDRHWGAAFARYTTEVAKISAKRRCHQRSRSPANCDVHVVQTPGLRWLVSVSCGQTYSTSSGKTLQEAHDDAVQESRKQGDYAYCRQIFAVNATFGEEIDEYEWRILESQITPSAPVPVPTSRPSDEGTSI